MCAFLYEKWEICNVVLKGIKHETQVTLESICYRGLCFLNVDDMWNFFESLASYQWHYEYANQSFMCPFPPPYDLQSQSPWVDQSRDVCDLTMM